MKSAKKIWHPPSPPLSQIRWFCSFHRLFGDPFPHPLRTSYMEALLDKSQSELWEKRLRSYLTEVGKQVFCVAAFLHILNLLISQGFTLRDEGVKSWSPAMPTRVEVLVLTGDIQVRNYLMELTYKCLFCSPVLMMDKLENFLIGNYRIHRVLAVGRCQRYNTSASQAPRRSRQPPLICSPSISSGTNCWTEVSPGT